MIVKSDLASQEKHIAILLTQNDTLTYEVSIKTASKIGAFFWKCHDAISLIGQLDSGSFLLINTFSHTLALLLWIFLFLITDLFLVQHYSLEDFHY